MKNNIPHLRHLTISSLVIKNRWSRIKKPKLMLSGNWMKTAGFGIGEKVIIEINSDTLVIRKIKKSI